MDALAILTTARTLPDALGAMVAGGVALPDAKRALEAAAAGLWCGEAWALLVDELLSLRRAQMREEAIARTLDDVRSTLPDLAEEGAFPAPKMGPDPLSQRAGSIARLGDTSAKLLLAESKIRDAIERRRTALERRLLALQAAAHADPIATLRQLAALSLQDGALDTARVLLAHVERRELVAGTLTTAAAEVAADPITLAAERVRRAWVGAQIARLHGTGEIAAEEDLDRARSALLAAERGIGTDEPADVVDALSILHADADRGRV